MHTHAHTLAPRTRACAWRGSDMRLRLGVRAPAALLTRASADKHARARAACSCVFPTGPSVCTTTGWRACRRPSSPASRASGMSRSLSPRPHTLARTYAHVIDRTHRHTHNDTRSQVPRLCPRRACVFPTDTSLCPTSSRRDCVFPTDTSLCSLSLTPSPSETDHHACTRPHTGPAHTRMRMARE